VHVQIPKVDQKRWNSARRHQNSGPRQSERPAQRGARQKDSEEHKVFWMLFEDRVDFDGRTARPEAKAFGVGPPLDRRGGIEAL